MTERPPIHVNKDVEVRTRDGGTVLIDVLRPPGDGPHPAIVTMGAYGKDIRWADRYPDFPSLELHDDMNWETPDPWFWVPQGYALVRADSPGTGKSPGVADLFGPTEQRAYYDVIEWAAEQTWCNGRIGALGISYYAVIQWLVAALQPPHLTAIIPWEGFNDLYREWAYQGGIFSDQHNDRFWEIQFIRQQHGYGVLSEEELAANAVDWRVEMRRRRFDDDWYRARSADLSRITVPLLSAANWSSLHLHLRGNVEGFTRAASEHKWMVMYSGNHLEPFYSEWGREVQQQFFDYWLKGIDNGMLDVPRVRVGVRHGREVRWRDEQEWPLASTRWTDLHLDAGKGALTWDAPDDAAEAAYPAPEGATTFETDPVEDPLEITGPVVLTAWVSSTSPDMDLFVTLRHIDVDGEEISVSGPHGHGQEFPMAMGWLRASRAELDPDRTLPHRPFHGHQRELPLSAGEAVEVQVEIWPTSITLAPGERLRLVISANDDYLDVADWAPGVGHSDPEDRSPERFAGENRIHTGGAYPSRLMLPVIPPAETR